MLWECVGQSRLKKVISLSDVETTKYTWPNILIQITLAWFKQRHLPMTLWVQFTNKCVNQAISQILDSCYWNSRPLMVIIFVQVWSLMKIMWLPLTNKVSNEEVMKRARANQESVSVKGHLYQTAQFYGTSAKEKWSWEFLIDWKDRKKRARRNRNCKRPV